MILATKKRRTSRPSSINDLPVYQLPGLTTSSPTGWYCILHENWLCKQQRSISILLEDTFSLYPKSFGGCPIKLSIVF